MRPLRDPDLYPSRETIRRRPKRTPRPLRRCPVAPRRTPAPAFVPDPMHAHAALRASERLGQPFALPQLLGLAQLVREGAGVTVLEECRNGRQRLQVGCWVVIWDRETETVVTFLDGGR